MRTKQFMTFFTRKLLSVYDDIHNTVWNDNKLHHGLPVQGAFHAIKFHDGGLDQILRHALLQLYYITALAIDLNRNGDLIIHNEGRNRGRPRSFDNGLLMDHERPAFFGQMRHHGRKHQDQKITGLPDRERQIRRGIGYRQSSTQGIRKLINPRYCPVETERGQIIGHGCKGAVGDAAQLQSRRAKFTGERGCLTGTCIPQDAPELSMDDINKLVHELRP